jgi:hypothetical protein
MRDLPATDCLQSAAAIHAEVVCMSFPITITADATR